MCTGIFSKHGGSGGRRTQVLKPNPTHHPLWRSWSHRALDWGHWGLCGLHQICHLVPGKS